LALSNSKQNKALKHPCVYVTRHGDYVFMSQSAAVIRFFFAVSGEVNLWFTVPSEGKT